MPKYHVQVTIDVDIEHKSGADAISEVCDAIRNAIEEAVTIVEVHATLAMQDQP